MKVATVPPPTEAPSVPQGTGLDRIAPGSRAVVRVVAAENGARRRLLEMGFVPGTALRVVRLAPLGDPMEIELHGYHVSLRRSEARTILVEPA
ncbi:MAG TPA: ferrous iron transport protein A [Planctomycetota bacterium]|nr:ferrous iron transport protein A [Planctomycetota bacterium]